MDDFAKVGAEGSWGRAGGAAGGVPLCGLGGGLGTGGTTTAAAHCIPTDNAVVWLPALVQVNTIYAKYFEGVDHPPARATFAVAG